MEGYEYLLGPEGPKDEKDYAFFKSLAGFYDEAYDMDIKCPKGTDSEFDVENISAFYNGDEDEQRAIRDWLIEQSKFLGAVMDLLKNPPPVPMLPKSLKCTESMERVFTDFDCYVRWRSSQYIETITALLINNSYLQKKRLVAAMKLDRSASETSQLTLLNAKQHMTHSHSAL